MTYNLEYGENYNKIIKIHKELKRHKNVKKRSKCAFSDFEKSNFFQGYYFFFGKF